MEPPAVRGMGRGASREGEGVFRRCVHSRGATWCGVNTPDIARRPGVDRRSDVETFCALRLYVDSWRWQGVPWYLRSGKCLAQDVTEVLVELKPPPQALFADAVPGAERGNYVRFHLAPRSTIAIAARVKRAGKEFVGDQRELYTCSRRSRMRPSPYERLPSEMRSPVYGSLFNTARDAVEARGGCCRSDHSTASESIAVPARQLGPRHRRMS
jgi:glucose-6-phosphate 1-dehydrogenase